jgi:hypothetical protein
VVAAGDDDKDAVVIVKHAWRPEPWAILTRSDEIITLRVITFMRLIPGELAPRSLREPMREEITVARNVDRTYRTNPEKFRADQTEQITEDAIQEMGKWESDGKLPRFIRVKNIFARNKVGLPGR